MIAIINVSKGPLPVFGLQKYEVRINQKVITTFNHRREDGLGACLIAAAKAVEQAKWDQYAQIYKQINTEGK
jgi:hypothetical protein